MLKRDTSASEPIGSDSKIFKEAASSNLCKAKLRSGADGRGMIRRTVPRAAPFSRPKRRASPEANIKLHALFFVQQELSTLGGQEGFKAISRNTQSPE